MIKDRILGWVLPYVPKNELSHYIGRLAHRRLPEPLARASVKWFADYYKIDMSEAEHPLEHYKTIGELFTRHLKPGARPIGTGFVHPADAVITEAGRIENQALIQAKGKNYSCAELLRSSHWAEVFEGGSYFTYYLCPTDYHRVHSPAEGRLVSVAHVPGEMWPVNEWSVRSVVNLFTINERIVMILETARGHVAVVMVAATNVGNMRLAFDETLRTNVRESEQAMRELKYKEHPEVKRGDELGVFMMGSTVIVLYEKDRLTIEPGVRRGTVSRMGASLE